MRYCVSDIHGEYALFFKLLDKIGFSDGDVLYVCGDVIDKGKDSVRLARFILDMPNAVCVAGNHEYAFLKYYWSIMRSSPEDFDAVLKKLREYFPYDGKLLDWDVVDKLELLPYYVEEEDFICVHAGVPLDEHSRILPLNAATREQLVYDRTFKEPRIVPQGGKCVLFGHTPTSYICGEDKILAYSASSEAAHIRDYYKVHLDTGTWLNGVLGCFCIDTCRSVYVRKT